MMNHDQKARLALIDHALELGLDGGASRYPLVSLESYFTGNNDPGAWFAPNLPDHPGAPVLFKSLQRLCAAPEVDEILVEIKEVEPDDPEAWPFADTIYLVTSLPPDEVVRRLEPWPPDEAEEGYLGSAPPGAVEPPPGYRVVAAFWD